MHAGKVVNITVLVFTIGDTFLSIGASISATLFVCSRLSIWVSAIIFGTNYCPQVQVSQQHGRRLDHGGRG